jgi:hypothetical protein
MVNWEEYKQNKVISLSNERRTSIACKYVLSFALLYNEDWSATCSSFILI